MDKKIWRIYNSITRIPWQQQQTIEMVKQINKKMSTTYLELHQAAVIKLRVRLDVIILGRVN